jgi:hypothetical protein
MSMLFGETYQHRDQAPVGEDEAAILIRAARVDQQVLEAQGHRPS